MVRILLQLSVPVYIKKILVAQFGEEYKAKENSLLGMTVINTMQRKSDHLYEYKRSNYSEGNYRFKNSTETYFVSISVDRAKRKGFMYDQRRAFQIVKAIDRSIREELYKNAVINKERYGIDYQTTLMDFLDMYDIDDSELSYESLRKDFNRNRLNIMEKYKF